MQPLVDNRYRLVWTLGSDGVAEVHLARDDVLGRDVVLKVLSGRHANDEEFVERFRNEARSAATLSHPNIISVFDQGRTEDGTYYIAMEYLPGGSLKERLAKRGPLPARRAAAVALQIAGALRAAHDRGVVHGALRPENVLITESGNVKVKDFGIARAAAPAATGDPYRSPEQASGGEVSPKSDLYSLGVILHEMLTGEPPSGADGHPGEPAGPGSSIPKGAHAVVARLISRNPEDRYADAAALVRDLERLAAGLEPGNAAVRGSRHYAPPETGAPRRAEMRHGRKRRRTLLLAIPLLAIVLVAALAWAGLGLLRATPQEARPEPRPEPRPVMLRVPELTGMTLEEARQKAGDDFDVVEEGRESGARPENTVLSQEPPGGQAERGTEIRVTVASGENEVPSVEGRTLDEARQALSDAGFEPAVTEAESAAEEEGLVLSQNPASGTAGVGSPVEVVVGTGPAPVEVPGLYGYTLDEAAARLQSFGLVLGGYDTAPSDEVAEGGIIAQSAAPGVLVEPGTAVGVTISAGPALSPVPNVVGLSLSRARQTLSGAGFSYDALRIPNAQWPRGTVLYTDPGTGALLAPGSTVTVGYSSGPPAPRPPARPRNDR